MKMIVALVLLVGGVARAETLNCEFTSRGKGQPAETKPFQLDTIKSENVVLNLEDGGPALNLQSGESVRQRIGEVQMFAMGNGDGTYLLQLSLVGTLQRTVVEGANGSKMSAFLGNTISTVKCSK